jgi:hypothetical protein
MKPTDTVIKALGDIKSILIQCNNKAGRQEKIALQKLGALFQTKEFTALHVDKRVTFKDLPTVTLNDISVTPHTIMDVDFLKHMRAAAPRVVTAVIDKPIGQVTPIMQRITHLQFFKDVSGQTRPRQGKDARMHTSDLERAMHMMETLTVSEMAQAIFDKDSGQVLTYRKLLTHPKYKEVWSHSSANKFGWLAQGVGTRIKGTNTIFFVTHQDVPVE